MTRITATALWRLSASVLVALTVSAFDCGESTGGGPKDARQCEVHGNATWESEGTTIDIVRPATCPYTVASVGSPLDYALDVDFLPSQITFFIVPGFQVFLQVFDANSVKIRDQSAFADQFLLPSEPGGEQPLQAEFTGNYPGGRGSKPRDSADVRYAASPGINGADGWAILPGNVSATSPSVSGASHVNYNSANTWHAVTQWDAVSYLYQWRLNGQNVAGATGSAFTTSFPNLGTYTVSTIVRRTDNTADTVTMSVTSQFVARILGPGNLDPNNGAGTWTVSAPGGYAPFSYQWWLDGQAVGTSSSFHSSIGAPSTSHNLDLRVTDAHGHVANASKFIFVTAGGTCLQQPCP